MQSNITSDATVELRLVEVPTPAPQEHEVVVRMEAAPINPSDMGLLFGPADINSVRVAGSGIEAVVNADIAEPVMQLVTTLARLDSPQPAGNEGAGVVVDAGASGKAQALLGKAVAIMGPSSYTQYRCVGVERCLLLPENTSPAEGAACFVNPLTALGMVETMRLEGHSALVHTVGASNLGQMLIKLCQAEDIELVNIVRKPEQAAQLESLGAKYICNSSSPAFIDELTEALIATGATLAFDAIGGGQLASQILNCMEVALSNSVKSQGRYGTDAHKQVYIYGGLDRAPTEIKRHFGIAWGVGGWLMPYFLERIGPEKTQKLKARIAAEIKSTFASEFAREISLAEALQPENIAVYGRQATGEKYLINPSKA